MKTPHKHAEVIKAYADGAQIQWRIDEHQDWQDIQDPRFFAHEQYRVKPEPRKGWYRVALMQVGGSTYTMSADSEMHEMAFTNQQDRFIRWLTPRTEYEIY